MVPGDLEDPGRVEGRLVSQLLKLCHLVCCTIKHDLGVDV